MTNPDLDHYQEDIKVLARMLNIDPEFLPNDYEKVNEHAAALNTFADKKSTKEMFQNISKSTLRMLRDIYRADYELFGFKMPQWLENA